MNWYDLIAIILLIITIGYWLWTIDEPIFITKKDLKKLKKWLNIE